MKIIGIFLLMIVGALVVTLMVAKKQPLLPGFTVEDMIVKNNAFINNHGTGTVVAFIAHTNGVSVVKIGNGPTNSADEIAQYAITVDQTITNGTRVRLVRFVVSDTTGSIHSGSEMKNRGMLAIRQE